MGAARVIVPYIMNFEIVIYRVMTVMGDTGFDTPSTFLIVFTC